MGAWGIGFFENDDSLDWVYEIEGTDNLNVLSKGLKLNIIDFIYLQAPKASIVLAASEVVAAGLGHPSDQLPEEIKRWLTSNAGLDFKKLAPKALSSLNRVIGNRSELRSLWSESENNLTTWQKQIEELRKRLSS